MSFADQREPTQVPTAIHEASLLPKVPQTVQIAPAPSSVTSCSSFTGQKSTSLPPKHHCQPVRHARHTFLNVYRRLFSIVFALNAIGIGLLLWIHNGVYDSVFLGHLATAAAANIMVALLARQDYIVNAIFKYVLRPIYDTISPLHTLGFAGPFHCLHRFVCAGFSRKSMSMAVFIAALLSLRSSGSHSSLVSSQINSSPTTI